jgi:hypothetical protein
MTEPRSRNRWATCSPQRRPRRVGNVVYTTNMDAQLPGLVSRASPIHTAVRNYTGDEEGPFGLGNQVTDPKPPRAATAKSRCGERRRNVGAMIPTGTV